MVQIICGFIILLMIELILFLLWVDTRSQIKDIEKHFKNEQTCINKRLIMAETEINALKQWHKEYREEIHIRLHDLKEAQDGFIERYSEMIDDVDNYNQQLESILNFTGKNMRGGTNE